MAGVDSDSKTIIKVGPAGWAYKTSPYFSDSDWDFKGVSKITRIFISLGEDCISTRLRSLQFQYIEDGVTKLSPVYGNSRSAHPGFIFETVVFNKENDDYITRLSGAALRGSNAADNRVTSLTIETNLKKYGPFGSIPEKASNFSFSFGSENQFAGLFGTSSSVGGITSIGCYFSPNLN